MAKYQFGFIGCGNMGGAILRAIASRFGGSDILISDRISGITAHFHQEYGVAVAENAVEVARCAKYIFLGVKPQGMKALLQEIAPMLVQREDRPILISMAAGITLDTVAKELDGQAIPVIRILPNTPAAIGKGMMLYCCNDHVSEQEERIAVTAFETTGKVDKIEEQVINAGCAVSGCGPAFVYMFLEAMADGAVAAGVPRQQAVLYAAQTLIGAAEMVLQSGQNPGALKDAVCSPGGSTIQGVRALESGAFRSAVIEAVLAAYEKTAELGK